MQFRLQRKTDLAVQALRVLAESDSRIRARDVAENLGSSSEFIFHVMAPLTRAGWVDSSRGPTGGYRLVVPLETISLLEVIEAVEGPTDTDTCVLQGGPCGPDEHCAVHGPFLRVRTALMTELANSRITFPLNEE